MLQTAKAGAGAGAAAAAAAAAAAGAASPTIGIYLWLDFYLTIASDYHKHELPKVTFWLWGRPR